MATTTTPTQPLPTRQDANAQAANETLNASATEALRLWQREHGRTWKARLRELWDAAIVRFDDPDHYHVVYALRNSHGPSWLTSFRLEAA